MNIIVKTEQENQENGKKNIQWLLPEAEQIPEEIRNQDRWVCWRLDRNPDPSKKDIKKPIRARDLGLASTTRAETWAPFKLAYATAEYQHVNNGGFLRGVGWVVAPGYVGIDLDNCRSPDSGEIESWAQEVIDRMDTYTEVSPSQTGVRLICRGHLPGPGRKRGNVEMYDESSPRYLTITGRSLGSRSIATDRQDAINFVHAQFFGKHTDDGNDRHPPPHAGEAPDDLEQILERAMMASNGQKFMALWRGDYSSYKSQSEADLALAGELAFWCGPDADRIDAMFRRSGLYRDKWERADYREDTIAMAMDRDRFYDWGVDGTKIDEFFKSAIAAPNLVPSNGKEEKKPGKPKAAGLPEIEDACDFCKRNLPLPPELIEGLLHQGSKMSLGGASKAYKSWALLNLALSVGYEKPWLGCQTVRSRVLVINLEIQQAFCRKRLNTLADARRITQERGWLDIWNLRGYATSHQEIFPKIVERVGNCGYGLIVLDPIYKLYGNTDENSASDVAALLNSIETVAVRTGAAVAFGTHFSKGNQAGKNSIDRVSGSGVFARDPDSILNLTAHEEPDCFTLEATLRNFPPMEPFVVKWDYPLFVRDASLNPADLKTPGRPSTFTAERLLEALGGSTMNATDWMKVVGCGKDTFYRLRPELEKAGKVQQDKEKRWHRT